MPPGKLFIHRGRRFYNSEYPDLHKLITKPTTLLLYPGPAAANIKSLEQLSPGEHYDIIALDGTWRQAKDIFNNNPFLGQARQVQLEHDHVSEYVIRTQPNSKSLCTIEAIALSLAVLENNDEIGEALIRPLRALCKFQLDHGAVVHSNKDDRDEILSRQEKQDRRQKQGQINGEIEETTDK